MEQENNYIDINRALWNERTIHHIKSDFYDMEGFLAGKSSLKDIELSLLGDIKGKTLLHLQCHFGQDTLSLARMGAKVTGVDLSDKAIDTANELAAQLQQDARFIRSDIYDLPNVHNEQYDIVFTSYGTIGWLPDIRRWAGVVSKFLKPGGQFVFAEFHPAVWMFDNDFKEVFYSYFNVEPIIEEETGTYANKNASLETKTITWNHPTSEVLNALIQSGLEINSFNEYDYSPYNCFNETEEFEPGKFRIKHLQNKIPMVFSLTATKK